MAEYFENHGTDGDVKAPRPENKSSQGGVQVKTKVEKKPNAHDNNKGRENEPSHSTSRNDR
jgi:hypothetical protein